MGKKIYTNEQKEEIYQNYLKGQTLSGTSKKTNIPLATIQRVVQQKVVEIGTLGIEKEKEKVNFENRVTEEMLDKTIWAAEKSLDHILTFLKNHVDNKNVDKKIRTLITIFGVLSDKITKFVEIKRFGRTLLKSDETHMILIERIISIVEQHVPEKALLSIVRELEESAVDRCAVTAGKTRAKES